MSSRLNREIDNLTFMSQINLLSLSLSLSLFPQPRMDQYFNQMEKIVKERKTSSRIRFMLQDIIDLRLVSVCACDVRFICTVVESPKSRPMFRVARFTMNFPTEVYFIDLSDLLENDSGCSGQLLLNGFTAALVIEFERLFQKDT